jgi:hypothetical protein
MPENMPANVPKQKMWGRLRGLVRRENREKATAAEIKQRATGLGASLVAATVGGYLWEKYPQIQRIGANGGRAGIDTRLVIAVPLGLYGLSPRAPRAVLDIAQTFAISYAWDKGGEIATQ